MATRSRRGQQGFTLLELMLVSALIVGAMSAAVYGLRSVTGAQARSEAYKIAATLRYLYNTSIADGATYRLVIDMDARSIKPERVEDERGCGVTLHLDDGAKKRFGDLARKAAESAKKKKKDKKGKPGEAPPPPPGPSFGEFSDVIVKPWTLAKNVEIVHVATLAHPREKDEGVLAIHVFPHGLIERALVVLESRDEDVYSVRTEPYQGQAIVETGELEMKDVFR